MPPAGAFARCWSSARDLAHGTSRWSSKLIHGGLRYLATGQFGIAHESASERHALMTRVAPHLTRPLAQVMPLYAPGHMTRGAYVGVGFGLGDGLRRLVGTPDAVLSAPGPIRTRRDAAPRAGRATRRPARRGARLGRTAHRRRSARRRRRAHRRRSRRVDPDARRGGARLGRRGGPARRADRRRAARSAHEPCSAPPACGRGSSTPTSHLRPSRGTHLVVESSRMGGSDVSLTVPVPGSSSRFVFTVPAPHGRTYIGITDVPADGDLPDVPRATDAEIDMLLGTVNTVMARPLERSDVIATFAGLRPLLDEHHRRRRGRRDERPVPPPRDPRVLDRRAQRRGRQAHDVPADGAGRDGCRGRAPVRRRRGRGIRHPIASARGRMASRSLGRDRGSAAARATLRRGGSVRRRRCRAVRPPRAG